MKNPRFACGWSATRRLWFYLACALSLTSIFGTLVHAELTAEQKRKQAAAAAEGDDDSTPSPSPKAKASTHKKKKKTESPAPKKKATPKASPTETPEASTSPSAKKKATKADDDEESPTPSPKAKSAKKKVEADADEDATPKPRKSPSASPSAKKKKAAADEGDEEATPTPKGKGKNAAKAKGSKNKKHASPAKKSEPAKTPTPKPAATPPPEDLPKPSEPVSPTIAPKPSAAPSTNLVAPPADITIEKSGLAEDQGYEPPPPPPPRRSFWSALFHHSEPAVAYHYLNRSLINQLRNAPVQRGRWKFIVVHNSGTRQGNARAFDYYHKHVRHMQNGLAYHFVIGNGTSTGNGQIEIGDRWTRQINGGHVHSDYLNNIALGICLVGDFNRDQPTRAQLDASEELIRYLRTRCGKADGREIPVRPHREVNPPRWATDCPGDAFPYGWFQRF